MTQVPTPQLLIKEINDTYTQGNFKNLRDYFNKQSQLLNFNFVEFSFSGAVANQKIAHGLFLIPQDVIITRLTGAGSITLNWGLFDSTNLDITTTGACRIRLFVGSYWNFQTKLGADSTDTQTVAPTPVNAAAVSAAIAAAAAATTTTTTTVTTTASAMPTGSVIDFAGSAAPSGWLLCSGAEISRTTYATLFAAIGTTYGAGDGATTFLIPDLRGRVAAGRDDMDGTLANRITASGSGILGSQLGASGGSENVAITIAQLPAHGHNVFFETVGSLTRLDSGCGGIAGITSGGTQGYITNSTAGSILPYIQATGSGTAHNNVQPTMIMNKIIKT